MSIAHNDVSYGALRLIDPQLRPANALIQARPREAPLDAYGDQWRRDVAHAEAVT